MQTIFMENDLSLDMLKFAKEVEDNDKKLEDYAKVLIGKNKKTGNLPLFLEEKKKKVTFISDFKDQILPEVLEKKLKINIIINKVRFEHGLCSPVKKGFTN